MPTVMEIKEHYEGLKTSLLTETFDIAAKAQRVDISMKPAVLDQLGPGDRGRVHAAEAALWAEEERNRLKTKFVELDLELRAAIQVRVEEIEAELSPEGVTADDLLRASSASPEALIAMMDLALAGGMESSALLALAAARQRDLSDVVAHTATVREDWALLIAELETAAGDPDLDPGERFETFAEAAPSKQDILSSPQRDINILGRLG